MEAAQLGDGFFGQPIAEVHLLGISGEIVERHDRQSANPLR
jgi:hypothetical protein